MSKNTFYFLLIICVLDRSAFAQILPNDAGGSTDSSIFRPHLLSAAVHPNLSGRCDLISGCFYTNIYNFHCGENEIVISSACVSNDDANSDSYCFIQNVAFVDQHSRKMKFFSYYYERDNQLSIYGAKCIKTNGEHHVELESTNLSNCEICEWSDYFDGRGEYVGSEKGMYGKTSFTRKPIILKNKKPIQNGEPIQRIEISTSLQ